MTEINDPIAWAERAEEDFILARTALRRKQPLTYGACFHAQQCAEKYMKALLISKGADFPKTHDLLMLNGLCSSNGIFLEIDSKHLNTLTDYAVRTRYPGNDPTVDDSKEALELAKLIRTFARKYLGL
ncbi:MAG TPA: HEPN domain-containing protein [Anaerolineales bacterium]|nr:HEPN domain-containing protein [Anaerolineales bacterium]